MKKQTDGNKIFHFHFVEGGQVDLQVKRKSILAFSKKSWTEKKVRKINKHRKKKTETDRDRQGRTETNRD